MKRIMTTLTASLLASALIASPVLAKDGNSGNGNGNGGASAESHGNGAENSNSNSAAGFAPSRTGEVPGQVKGEDESAKDYAPGQLKASDDIDDDTTASTGQPNFGTVISSIRAGKSDLSGLSNTPQVNFLDVDDLISGGSRTALDNALDDKEDQIGDLQDDIRDLELGLSETQLGSIVEAQVDADGDLTVFTD